MGSQSYAELVLVEPRRAWGLNSMGRPTAPLIREVLELIGQKLAQLGMRRRTEGVYTCDLGMEALGLLGLNRAVGRGQGWFEINPVIGAHHERLERLWDEIMGTKHGISATISMPIGYLMPENRYKAWTFAFEADDEAVVEDMVAAIRRYGIPFMRINGTLPGIISNLPKYGIRVYNAYRLPLAHFLLGDKDAATQLIHSELDSPHNPDDLAAQDYRRFAADLLSRLGSPMESPAIHKTGAEKAAPQPTANDQGKHRSVISLTREHLAVNLRTYGEDDLASRALTLTDEQMRRIGEIAFDHALTGMLLAKAVTLAAIEVLEGGPRLPKWSRRKLKGIYPGY